MSDMDYDKYIEGHANDDVPECPVCEKLRDQLEAANLEIARLTKEGRTLTWREITRTDAEVAADRAADLRPAGIGIVTDTLVQKRKYGMIP